MVGMRQIEPGVEIFLRDQPTDRIGERSKIENQPCQWLIAAHTQGAQIPQIIAKEWKTCCRSSPHIGWEYGRILSDPRLRWFFRLKRCCCHGVCLKRARLGGSVK